MLCLQEFCRGNQENGGISPVQELQEAESVRRHLDGFSEMRMVKEYPSFYKKSCSITIDNKAS